MDFVQIKERSLKKDSIELYPEFLVRKSRDLMVRGKSFYAIWDEEKGMWSTDEYDVQRIVDEELYRYYDSIKADRDEKISVRSMMKFSSNSWNNFKNYLAKMPDTSHTLDESVTFASTKVKKSDYVSKRLPYDLSSDKPEAYDELMNVLYSPEEREKIEWSIGSILHGDSKTIQKFVVLYGEGGTGKSTVLNIVQKLFEGYYTMFEAKALTSSGNTFSTEVFKTNPLVGIQHDGDLSKIEDNSKLNSIISHEEMIINEKFKSCYTSRINCFLFMGTNRPVKITDAKSGIIRRLIDVHPTGNKIPPKRYHDLMDRIDFELGSIANHCLEVYKALGKNHYSDYKPLEMMYETDVFYNFVAANYDEFKRENAVPLKRAYSIYKSYCDEALVDFKLPLHKFRSELKEYFQSFYERAKIDGVDMRSVYQGFKSEKFEIRSLSSEKKEPEGFKIPDWLNLTEQPSVFDEVGKEFKAQYANDVETPSYKWATVKSTLGQLDTRKLHYVMPPIDHIVIDFDLKNENGEKDFLKNVEAASKFPPTYAEVSKGGSGIHLHYVYDGDPSELSFSYANGIEIKVFSGNSSLRRKLSRCNGLDISHIRSGLPLKEKKTMLSNKQLRSEKSLRQLIYRNLRKEILPGTKPSMDFIVKILDDAYDSDLSYDVSDLRSKIFSFAIGSTHHSDECVKMIQKMKFKSRERDHSMESSDDNPLVFFDIEVFPNLFLVNWKIQGKEYTCVRMINPSPNEVAKLFDFKLVGFNCRRYDNHILYARYLGYDNLQLYALSQKIVSGDKNAMFGEAYNLSYTDVFDFSSKKQSLKKFEIELGIHHKELGFKWDEPVPEELWPKVAEYCDNDVIATEKVFEERVSDWIARQILADVADMTVNDTTNSLSTRIIFGKTRNPQSEFNYRFMGDESKIVPFKKPIDHSVDREYCTFDESGRPIFPGYKYDAGVSTYRGEIIGEGGYVYAEPGMHFNVALLDIASMHPSSIVAENLFGDVYTARFKELLDARIAIKHGDFERAKKMLGGKLAKYLDDPSKAKDLASALKIVINSVYGLTSARFENAFRDVRNVDNIVAKRGALFMVNLKHEVQARGFTVAHIKTDSIKIPNATPEIIDFVMQYGKLYGYNFEHEATYSRMCLVNDAVYIARYDNGEWTATGAQFAHPYVFKKLFSKEPIATKDLSETKSVTTALYLDLDEGLPDVSDAESVRALRKSSKSEEKITRSEAELMAEYSHMTDAELEKYIASGHNYKFVGKVGQFCPVIPGIGCGRLVREKDGEYYSANGAKGYRWIEYEDLVNLKKESCIDRSYFDHLVDEAIHDISEFGDFEMFVSDDEFEKEVKAA